MALNVQHKAQYQLGFFSSSLIVEAPQSSSLLHYSLKVNDRNNQHAVVQPLKVLE
uniref:Uncharacterized protein n=1 Tax=Meloidogyne incognita TaxID=6306 RepID=A0A914KWQ5_MELIC